MNNNLKRPVSPNSVIKQPGVVHSPIFVQKEVELVSFDPEGDERGGLVSVSVTGYLWQRDCDSPASAWSQRGLCGHGHHPPALMQNHLADRAPAEQDTEPHHPRSYRQAAQREAVPPGVWPQVHLKAPHPRESGGGGGRRGLPFPGVSEPGVSEVAQGCPEEELATAEDREEPEEASPVVLEQDDVSGGLGGGAEAGSRQTVSDTAAAFEDEHPAAVTCCTGNHVGHRHVSKDSDFLLNIDESKSFGVTLQCPAEQPL